MTGVSLVCVCAALVLFFGVHSFIPSSRISAPNERKFTNAFVGKILAIYFSLPCSWTDPMRKGGVSGRKTHARLSCWTVDQFSNAVSVDSVIYGNTDWTVFNDLLQYDLMTHVGLSGVGIKFA